MITIFKLVQKDIYECFNWIKVHIVHHHPCLLFLFEMFLIFYIHLMKNVLTMFQVLTSILLVSLVVNFISASEPWNVDLVYILSSFLIHSFLSLIPILFYNAVLKNYITSTILNFAYILLL